MKNCLGLFFLFMATLSAQQDVLSDVDNYIETKEYVKAKTTLLKEISKQSTTSLKERLGDVYSYLKEWDKAISIYKELVKVDSKNAEYQFKYGGAIARKAESSTRIKALTLIGKIRSSFLKAADLDADHIEVRWGLLDYYTSLPSILGGSISKAYDYANELKVISPIEGYFALGYVYKLDGKPKKAKENFNKTFSYIDGLEKVERNQLNYLIGKVCSDYNSKVDEGILHLKEFVKRYSVKDGVPVSHAYYRLAKLYRLKEDRKNADYWIKKALAGDSNFQLAQMERNIIEQL